jgi:pyruvate,water dikinase
MSAVAGLPMVVPLDEPADLDMVGGKTVSLTRLRSAGLPVPDGFTVTTAGYRAFVAVHGLQEQILHGPTERIATLFASHPMPDSVAAPIRAAYAAMGAPAVVVRSSATAEDLPELSFAGQQDSFVDVRGAEAVLDAVRR